MDIPGPSMTMRMRKRREYFIHTNNGEQISRKLKGRGDDEGNVEGKLKVFNVPQIVQSASVI